MEFGGGRGRERDGGVTETRQTHRAAFALWGFSVGCCAHGLTVLFDLTLSTSVK